MVDYTSWKEIWRCEDCCSQRHWAEKEENLPCYGGIKRYVVGIKNPCYGKKSMDWKKINQLLDKKMIDLYFERNIWNCPGLIPGFTNI